MLRKYLSGGWVPPPSGVCSCAFVMCQPGARLGRASACCASRSHWRYDSRNDRGPDGGGGLFAARCARAIAWAFSASR